MAAAASVTEERPALLDAFRLRDGDGRIGPGLRWGSILLCAVDIAVYAVCIHLLSGPLDIVTAMAPGWLSGAVGILIPPAVGTVLCSLAWPAFRERRMMGAACRRMLVLSLWAFAAAQILLWGDREAQVLILRAFAAHVLPAVLMDAGAVLFLYRRWLWEGDEDEEDE